jgi:TonB family protein
MYFDFDDRYTDIEPVGRAINLRDGVVVSIVFHVIAVAVLLFAPALLPERAASEEDIVRLKPQQESPQFVFVQPRVDAPARPRERADLSDLDRRSRSTERAPVPENPLPFARGNSSERVESTPEDRARGRGPAEQPAPEVPKPESIPPAAREDSQTALAQKPQQQQPPPGGSLGEALRNLQKYVQKESFENQKGGNTQEFGPAIQFDTKGVEFGPWIRRFVAQVKRNWFIPYAAMTMRGHVVITFNVHRNGLITDVSVVKPSLVESFNTAAVNALIASSPTEPLPPEYPDDKAFFTVTFFYNESPGGQQ